MRWLCELERTLGALVEGLFIGRGSRIEPIEIGRRLASELMDNRKVSVSKTYIPNAYTVQLSSVDYSQMKSIEGCLISELRTYLSGLAQKERLSFVGALKIELVKDQELKPGRLQVTSEFMEDESCSCPEAELQTIVLQRVRSEALPDPEGDPNQKQVLAELRIIRGSGTGNTLKVDRAPIRLGRGYDNDLVISDPKVSRNHAIIELNQEGFSLVDLGSLNGTTVNGKTVEKSALKDGDTIGIGSVTLEFHRVN